MVRLSQCIGDEAGTFFCVYEPGQKDEGIKGPTAEHADDEGILIVELIERACVFGGAFQFSDGADENDEDENELAGVLPEEGTQKGFRENVKGFAHTWNRNGVCARAGVDVRVHVHGMRFIV